MMEATAFFGRPDAVVVLITSEMGHKQASYRPRSPAMSAHLAFVDDAHFAQENGAFRPHLLPFCYRRLVNRTKRRFHDLRGLVVTARDQVPIDIQGDCGISVTKPARDGQNVHAARDQH